MLQQANFEVEQLQKNIVQPLNNLFQKNPFLSGNLIKDVVVTSGPVKSVPHLLGKKYQGYFITKLNANAVVWVANQEQPEIFLNLSSSATCTVDLWVF